jgi:hypothetical protein
MTQSQLMYEVRRSNTPHLTAGLLEETNPPTYNTGIINHIMRGVLYKPNMMGETEQHWPI